MQVFGKHLWASAAVAVVGSLCCVAPLGFVALGISGAWIGQLTALEPYRPLFVGASLAFLGLAFRQLYLVPRHCEPGDACADPLMLRRQRWIYWVVVVGLVALLAFPRYASFLFD